MSIYATIWELQFPSTFGRFGVTVTAQGVPAHIGSPTPGCGYEDGDPYGDFLPPPIVDRGDGSLRAVVIILDSTAKGTERSGQEYVNPLLVLSGAEYKAITFDDLHSRLVSILSQRGD